MLIKRTSRRGFTIIELLFVIAIIGVMSALGLSLLNKQAMRHKIQKTAMQMQQLLQAGVAYSIDNSPAGGDELWPYYKFASVPPFTPYVPMGSGNNPWGYSYYYAGPSGIKQEFREDVKGRFRVWTPVPTVGEAYQIRDLLPNAQVYTKNPLSGAELDQPWVAAEITKTGGNGGGDPNPVQLVGGPITVGQSNYGDESWITGYYNMPKCTGNAELKVIPIMSSVELSETMSTYALRQLSIKTDCAADKSKCRFLVTVMSGHKKPFVHSGKNLSFYYLVFCSTKNG